MVWLYAQYVVKNSYIIHNQYTNYHVAKVLNIIVVIPAGGKREEINRRIICLCQN